MYIYMYVALYVRSYKSLGFVHYLQLSTNIRWSVLTSHVGCADTTRVTALSAESCEEMEGKTGTSSQGKTPVSATQPSGRRVSITEHLPCTL
jgi:hypothetical protein